MHRIYSVKLENVICFTTAHRLTVFIHRDGKLSILSPDNPHHIHAYLHFIKDKFNNSLAFSGSLNE